MVGIGQHGGGRNVRVIVVSLLIAGWMLAFTWPGLMVTFQGDDMMNMYRAWTEPSGSLLIANLSPFTHVYRPIGLAFYRILYDTAGFHPAAFRIVVYVFLLVNVWLAYGVAARISGSREIGAIVALIVSFHPGLRDLYQNGGTIFDILCFTFFYAAIWIYVRGGSRIAFLLFSVLALNAKEMAVTLPAVLWVYEYLYNPPRSLGAAPRWLISGKVALLILTAVVAVAIPFKTGVASLFANNPGYARTIGIEPFLVTTRSWISQLLYGNQDALPAAAAVAVLFAPLAIGLLLRRRELIFCGVLIPILPLPVNFIPLRNFFVMYVPLLPWAMFAAICVVALRDWLFRDENRFKTELTFAAVALALLPANGRDPHEMFRHPDPSQANIRILQSGFSEFCPNVPRGGHILLRGDPFPTDVYDPLFLARLYYRDQNLELSRTLTESQIPIPKDVKWDCALEFVEPGFRRAAAF